MCIEPAVLYKNDLVSGASSYAVSDSSIEIEVDTKPEHRKKGLALACCAKLTLNAAAGPVSRMGIRPQIGISWQKTGYHLDYSYTAYCVTVLRKNPAAYAVDMPMQEL